MANKFTLTAPLEFGKNGPTSTFSTSNPEGVVTAPPGSEHRNSSTGTVWRKTSGTGNTGWEQLGLTGPQGPQGPTGPQGPPGTDILEGTNPSTAALGDLYWDTDEPDPSYMTMEAGDGRYMKPADHINSAHASLPLSSLAVPTSDVSMNAKKLTNLGAPTGSNDAARKQDVTDATNVPYAMCYGDTGGYIGWSNAYFGASPVASRGITISGHRLMVPKPGLYLLTGSVRLSGNTVSRVILAADVNNLNQQGIDSNWLFDFNPDVGSGRERYGTFNGSRVMKADTSVDVKIFTDVTVSLKVHVTLTWMGNY